MAVAVPLRCCHLWEQAVREQRLHPPVQRQPVAVGPAEPVQFQLVVVLQVLLHLAEQKILHYEGRYQSDFEEQ